MIFFLLMFFLYSSNLFSQDELPSIDTTKEKITESGKKVIYKYKTEDYFDFDALQVQGQILSPLELSVKSNKRIRFNTKDYIRKDFDKLIRGDLIDIH